MERACESVNALQGSSVSVEIFIYIYRKRERERETERRGMRLLRGVQIVCLLPVSRW